MELSEEQKQQLEAQKAQCPFCKIISGEIPSQKVYEDEYVIAILDINPLRPGHTLVVPKEHHPIMPFLPKDEFNHLFGLIPEMTARLKKAMLAQHCYTYIANGAAAGQQAGHFMVHLIPSDTPIPQFSPPTKEIEKKPHQELKEVLANNLPIMMRERSELFKQETKQEQPQQDPSVRLAELLEENPDFKETLMNNPQAIKAGVQENPSLKELFAGIDVDSLSKKLNEQQPPQTEPIQQQEQPLRAVDMSDQELKAFLEEKQKLKELLHNDLETLTQAITQQEKLQVFFEDTSPSEVLARLTSKSSLEDAL